MKLRLAFLFLAVLALAAYPAFAQDVCQRPGNQLVNCGFETGDFTGWTQWGDTSFTFVDGNPYSGNYAAWFGEVNGQGGVYQNVGATNENIYYVSFWLQNLYGGDNFMTVYWNGYDVGPDLYNAPAFGYEHLYGWLSGYPCAGCNTIQFAFYQPPSYWNFDSAFVGSPEPTTLLLVGTGIVGLATRMRKRL